MFSASGGRGTEDAARRARVFLLRHLTETETNFQEVSDSLDESHSLVTLGIGRLVVWRLLVGPSVATRGGDYGYCPCRY